MKAVLQLSNTILQKRNEITIQLAQNVVFGRGDKADFIIDDGKMSSNHCRVILKEDRMEIYDLSSKNGTYLNGIRIDQSEMFIGDEIRIGDTFLTLLASKLEASMINILTFPGPFKERMQYELKADFTGAREKNQDWAKNHPGDNSSVYSAHEIDLRKRAKTKIRLSKNEIKSKSPLLSSLSFIIDLTLLLSMILLPVWFINRVVTTGLFGIPGSTFVSGKIVYITVMEVIVIGAYLASQRYMNYTLGERISGIQDLHQQQ